MSDAPVERTMHAAQTERIEHTERTERTDSTERAERTEHTTQTARTERTEHTMQTAQADHAITKTRFSLQETDSNTSARSGEFHTAHGVIETPAFMPVGTHATVKGLTSAQLTQLGAQVILANSYHLYLRPGTELIAKAGGLHGFMAWRKPILTDSGGFQVFSLANTLKLDDDGVSFQSIIDGSHHRWTPEDNMRVQNQLGADIIMQLDECPPYPAEHAQVARAVRRSADWARRCRQAHENETQALFAINQGGLYDELRRESAMRLLQIDADSAGFAGFGIGGYSVGEPHALMLESLSELLPLFPPDKPRYLMGVGNPTTLVRAVALGVDMFDCVLPTRTARMGSAFSSEGRLNLRNARFKNDLGKLDPSCDCPCCQEHSRAYLRHLIVSKEMLAAVLLSIHNLHYLLDLMRKARQAVVEQRYDDFLRAWEASPAADDY
jgi:queuine tRNA-ribosyltransferase